MKKLLILLFVLFYFQISFAQETTEVVKDTPYNFSGIDVKPEFVGGMSEFYKFIGKNYNMPNVKGLTGKVYVGFVIEIDGSIGDIKIMKDLGYGTGEEAIRVLKLCPKWKPAELNGQNVRCSFALPISLQSN
jgi:periplasmic protein TonB